MQKNTKKLTHVSGSEAPKPPTLGQSMVNITQLTTTRPDFQALTKPTQQSNGLRQFRDEKGVFYETDQSPLPKGKVIINE